MDKLMSNLFRDYQNGCSFKPKDELRPKSNAERWRIPEVVDDKVVVLHQDSLVPHEYTVIGERKDYKSPSDRFVKFSINGHDWERI